ncbi:MAG: PaaI family thioesterase [Actinomycetota bacterium]|nr:PaaI family thioesterase [Actinomycetota bacterium]
MAGEGSGGGPGDDGPGIARRASPERLAAATSLRRLGHAVVAHEAPDALLERVAVTADRLLVDVEAAPPRERPVGSMSRRFEAAPADGAVLDHFPDCVVSGHANPLGIAIDVRREGDDAVARVVLGAAFEGAPGRAHGGVVAAIFDDTLGFVLDIVDVPAYTGRLSVSYLAPTPVHEEIEFRARLRHREGRKLLLESEATVAGVRIAEAEGLFVAIAAGQDELGGQA